jgi:hypothetical protein
MQNPVTCKGRAYVTFLVTGTGVSVAIAILATVSSAVFVAVLFSAFAIMSGMELSRTCHRVELRSDDHLVLHYLFRRRVIRPGSISSITLDKDPEGGPSKFVVLFVGGRFEVSANRSARRLVDALSQLQPTISVTGYEPLNTADAGRSGVR